MSDRISTFPFNHSILMVGHPLHILQVYGWLKTIKPEVYILTDGSGRSGISQMGIVNEILDEINIPKGSLYGKYTDQKIYDAILKQDFDFFIEQTNKLVQDIIKLKADFIFGDAAEGYNPTHDICRMIIGTAVELVNQSGQASIANYDFALARDIADCPEWTRKNVLQLMLSDEDVNRKFIYAKSEYPEIFNEDGSAFRGKTPDFYKIEYLRPCDNLSGLEAPAEEPLFYERHGEKRSKSGYYKDVIRYRQHIQPIAKALWGLTKKRNGTR